MLVATARKKKALEIGARGRLHTATALKHLPVLLIENMGGRMLVATDDPCLVLQWFDALSNEELKNPWPHEAHRRLLGARIRDTLMTRGHTINST